MKIGSVILEEVKDSYPKLFSVKVSVDGSVWDYQSIFTSIDITECWTIILAFKQVGYGYILQE